ncbi:MAG TPA: SRPBCC domain-containing protein [Nitrospirota bacterium]|nr:SRPBCC domain-containing protein [Nitrospirota bacterium]
MATKTMDRSVPGSREGDLTIIREFNASRGQVWKAWTDPEAVKQWWGPKNFTTPVTKIDLRAGGSYLYCMRGAGPDGVVRDYWGTGIYREIVPLEKIVCTDSFADEKGNVVPASYYGMEGDWPLELQITVTFQEHEGRTTMTLRHAGIPVGRMRELTEAGWNESFDKLIDLLAKQKVERKAA